MNIADINSLKDKINIIKDCPNESCKYLVNTFDTYKKTFKENEKLIKEGDINKLFEKDSILIESENNKDTFNKLMEENEDVTIICFDNGNISERIEHYKTMLSKYKNISLVLVRKNIVKLNMFECVERIKVINISRSKIKKILLSKKVTKVLIYINIETIDIGNDWEDILISNFEKILNNFNSFEKNEIEKNQERFAQESILCEKYKYKKTNNSNILKAEKIMKLIMFIKSVCNNKGISFGKDLDGNLKLGVIGGIKEFNYINKIKVREVCTCLKTISINNKREKIEYIYDKLCERIDKDLVVYKYCNFNNNKCIAQRDNQNKNGYPVNECNGCCYKVEEKIECEKLKNKECTTSCISCRLFICKYLQDRGIEYKVTDNLQIRTFFNFMQRPILVWSFFRTREEIIKELMRC